MDNARLRRGQILHLLENNGSMSCKELATWLDVSEMTIRRDLNNLQEAKAIVRGLKAGTFTLSGPNIHAKEDYSTKLALDRDPDEKGRIGKFAASLVKPDDSIIIDNGTTTVQMVSHIDDNIKFSALCNSIDVFNELEKKENVDITLVGGQFHKSTMSFYSADEIVNLRNFRANKFFMAASGVHESLGITCGHSKDRAFKLAAIDASLTKILLVNSTKFGFMRLAYVCELDKIDVIITDSNIPPEWERIIADKGIKLHIV